MSRHFICSAVAVVGLSAACTPVPVELSGEIDVNVSGPKEVANDERAKSVTNVTMQRVVGELATCPKLNASLVNTEVSGGTKICYYIAEKET